MPPRMCYERLHRQHVMRVLVWSEGFWPHIGGVEVLTSQLLAALRSRGYEFTVVTSQDGPLDLPACATYDGMPIHRFPFSTALRNGIEAVMRVRAAVAQLKRSIAPDLVHIHAFGPSVFFHLHTRAAAPAPLLVTLHGGLSAIVRAGRGVDDTLLGQTLRLADWVCGVSAAALAEVLPLAPHLAARSSVIRNGVAAPRCATAPPVDPPQILFVGRLVPEKGADVALRAFAELLKQRPTARLIIAGDGHAREALERLAGQLGVTGRTEFLGWVSPDRVPALCNAASAVIVPSRRESFGLVAVEAALMGRPVVAARVGGLPGIVVDGETGILVQPEDVPGFAAALAALVANPAQARALGTAARRRAQSQFTLDACAGGYDRLYQALRGRSSDARIA